jgi:hypothetical protein
MIERAYAKETMRMYHSQENVDKYNQERERLPTYTEIKSLYFFGPKTK